MKKICSKCKVEKELDLFSPSSKGKLGRHSHCNECKRMANSTPEARARQKAYREANKAKAREYMREYHLNNTYNITIEDWKGMLEAQDGKCAMCPTEVPGGTHNTWHVDHCHATGKVRALLCFTCNRNLGFYETYKEACEEYLKEYGHG